MPIYANQQRKQKYMIFVFLAVLLVTLIVLYFGFLKDKIKIGGAVPSLNPDIAIEGMGKSVNIDFGIFESEDFKKLTPFQDAVPFAGRIGKEEPFKP